MIRSHLLEAFLTSAWYLHTDVYQRLSDLLEAHVTGRKADLRGRDVVPLAFLDDGAEDEPIDENTADYIDAGVAIIQVRGVLAMHADQVNGDCQPQGRSYERITEQVQLAAADPAVRSIVLRLETPGGSASGCQECYDAIVAADAIKPVHAFVAPYGFSAGYYLASACRSITASSVGAHTGSIGTVMATWDESAAFEKEGFKRVVIRSGAYKALAQRGEAITDTVRAELQRECDAYAAAFYDAVRAGRGLTDEQAAQVLNGRTFLAPEAMRLGLIDAIQPFTQFIAGLHAQETPMFGIKKPTPTSATETPAAATPAPGLTKAEYAALAGEFPAAIERLQALDAEGKSASEITTTLLREALAAANAKVTAQANEAATAATAHTAAIAAKDAQIADLTAKVEKTKAWTGTVGAVGDPGSKDITEHNAMSEEAIKARWNNDATLRAEFFGDLANLTAFIQQYPAQAAKRLN